MGLISAVLLSVIAMESVSCYLCLAWSCSLTEQLQEHSHTVSFSLISLLSDFKKKNKTQKKKKEKIQISHLV